MDAVSAPLTLITLPVPQALELLFFLILFVTTLYSSFLVYHWYAYGEKRSTNLRTSALYLGGVAVCIAGMLTAIGMTF